MADGRARGVPNPGRRRLRAAIEAAVREMADPVVTESEPEPESMSDLTDLSKAETERADSDMLGFEESD